MSSTEKLYLEYKSVMQKVADVKYAAAVLQWDQETYLPEKGAEFRGRQLATLSEISHEMFINDKNEGLLKDLLSKDLPQEQKRNVALTWEDYSRLKKLTPEFVRKMSETVSASFFAWIEARKQNSYKIFEPKLAPLVDLKRQEAELYGYEGHPYNALMDEYEKGATVQKIDTIFEDIKLPLRQLLSEIQNDRPVDDSFLRQHFLKQQQWEWGMYLAKQLGFDFERGRQDISEHPFTTNFSSQDVRITTRIDEHDFANMTWSTIHEVGHALYEQGLPPEQYGLPLGEYASLGIHESQSRLWENCVGRGNAFWSYYLPQLKQFFPEQFKDVSKDQFLKAINKVQPSLVRAEADELTYHFHVMVRYELEKRLIEGSLQVKEIPLYWNDQYKALLGVDVPDDKSGCLQDVHWSHGSFGYFATYSLGSFYAAQLWQHANKTIPGLETEISQQGKTKSLLLWLRNNVHKHGRFYNSNELCAAVTGHELDSKVFVSYLKEKLNDLK
ncbi:carboxypeptidase M32 [Segetibacter aerophilus]|uniref:Metal-dependent carboxypeptidase n=1 Tax=Segetibacter aerophilus TaxID=670293 RepID=A0A512BAY3_9BACT|nr:carboxypeptidase M32 [Segetibacter aerophilus]GEO09136.1 carboxypeptidase M32 [Segetibacter aerophilus]